MLPDPGSVRAGGVQPGNDGMRPGREQQGVPAWPRQDLIEAARVADALGQGFFLLDAKGRLLLINRASRRLSGHGSGALTLRSLLKACFPTDSDRDAARSVLLGVARDRVPAQLSTVVQGGERIRNLLLQAAAVPDAASMMVVVSILDVSMCSSVAERPEACAGDMDCAADQLSPGCGPFRSARYGFFDANPDLCVTLDARGRIEQLNRRALASTGFVARNVVGRHFSRFLGSHARRRVREAFDTFASAGAIDNLEFDIVGKDGRRLEVVASARARGRMGDGLWQGAWVVLHDVTRRNLLQRQLRQADRLAVTGRLAAGVVHEINNPIQAILMHLAIVESALPEAFDQRDSWKRIVQGVRRIRQVGADLLDLHRGPSSEDSADLNRVTREALGLVRAQFRKAGIRVRTELAPDLPSVSISSRHLYQIILNLLLNALGVMPQGGILTVRSRGRRGIGDVAIEIADTGPGVSAEIMQKIFEPFLTGKDDRGTGLGLFVTYGLIRDSGGRVRVDSAAGRGTTFRIHLPCGDSAR